MAAIKWIVPKEALEQVVALLDNVPVKNAVLTSEFIKISKAGKDGASFHLVSTLGGKAMLRTGEQFPFENDLFLDRRLFTPFVSGGKESKTTDYVFIGNTSTLTVKHGNRKAVYSYAKSIDGYEEPESMDSANSAVVHKKWTGIIDCAENCSTDDPITPSLNCVFITQTGKYIEAMSSNQRLVFYGKAEVEKKMMTDSIAFPLGLVKALRIENASKLRWTNKLAVVECPKGKIWQAVKTAARKSFPHKDIRTMVEGAVKDPVIATFTAHAFAKAADRLAGYVSALDSADLALELHLEKGSKKVRLVSGVTDSKFDEIVHSLIESDADRVLEWPLEHVMPIILFVKDEGNMRVHLSKTGRSCLSTKSVTLLIPPRAKEK